MRAFGNDGFSSFNAIVNYLPAVVDWSQFNAASFNQIFGSNDVNGMRCTVKHNGGNRHGRAQNVFFFGQKHGRNASRTQDFLAVFERCPNVKRIGCRLQLVVDKGDFALFVVHLSVCQFNLDFGVLF